MKDSKGGRDENQFINKNNIPQNLKKVINSQNKQKRNTFNKGIYNININNFNINTRKYLPRTYSNKTIEIMKDFKKVLEKTELIKKTLFNDKRIFTNFNTNNNNDKIKRKSKLREKLYLKNDLRNNFKLHKSPININRIKIFNNDKDFSSQFASGKYRKYKTPTINRKISYINSSTKNLNENLEESNINFKNKNLKKEGDFLVNENALLSSRLKECKSKIQKTKSFNKCTNINYFDENLKKFINSLKSSLNYNLNNNLDIAKLIIKTLKEIKSLKKNFDFKLRIERNKNLISKKIEENNKKYNKLKKENYKLINELEMLKINMTRLKSTEKLLSLKYESELKSKQDKIDLITKLKFTMIKLNKSQQGLNKNRLVAENLKLNNINKSNKNISELNQLNLIFNFLSNQKNILININKKLKLDNDKTAINFDKNKIKELRENLDIISKNNLETKLKLEKKEKQIIILKDVINRYTKALNQGNMKDIIFKLDLDKLTKEDYDDREYKNLLINDRIRNSINKKNYFQNKKNIKQVNIIKTYEKILNQKDIEISNLEDKIEYNNGILKIIEDKVKPLYKKNNNNILPKANSFIYSKSFNNLIDINSIENIDKKSKQEKLFDKLRKKKNKNLYMDNIHNNFNEKLISNKNYLQKNIFI